MRFWIHIEVPCYTIETISRSACAMELGHTACALRELCMRLETLKAREFRFRVQRGADAVAEAKAH